MSEVMFFCNDDKCYQISDFFMFYLVFLCNLLII